MLTGQNGILGKASEAKLYSERTSLLEALQLKISEYMIDGVRTNEEAIKKLKEEGYINEDNTININKTAIQSMSTGKGSLDTGDVYVLEQRQKIAATSSENVVLDYYLVYYDKENNDIEIGKVFGFVNGENKVDLAEILEDFTKNPDKYTAEGQSPTNGDRAIGTDGKAVNMDLWNTRVLSEEDKSVILNNDTSYYTKGYSNDNIKDGKIQGTIPQYIKFDGKDGIYTVTDLRGAFYDCKDLKIAPEIPDTVTDMYITFYGCTNLTTAPKIPDGVTDMSYTFYGCTNLTTAPKIPDGVTDMSHTFDGCTSLTTAPEIPDSVIDMSYAFNGCTSLTTAPKILGGVTDMRHTFYGCTSLTTAPEILGSVTDMSHTFYGCTSLTTAPKILGSVTNMNFTFYGCTSLTTAPEIPSSVTSMGYTFSECTSLTGVVKINSKNITNCESCFRSVPEITEIQVPAGSTSYTTFYAVYRDKVQQY